MNDELREQARELSDEELDAQLSGEEGASEEESTPEEGSQETVETTEESTDTETQSDEEAPDEESTSEPEIPDWVPESLHKHYLEGKHEEAYKSVAHFQKKMGEISDLMPIVELMKLNPAARDKVVKALLDQEGTSKESPTVESEENKEIYELLEDAGLDALIPVLKAQEEKLNTLESQLTQTQKLAVEEANSKAIADFVADHPMPQEDLFPFLMEAEKRIAPSGKNGAYTKKDIEDAFKILRPQEYEESIRRKTKEEIMAQLNGARQNEPEPTPSSSGVQHDKTVKGKPGKLDESSPERLRETVGELTDEELEEQLKFRKLKSFTTPWK